MITKINLINYNKTQNLQRRQITPQVSFRALSPLGADTVSFQKRNETMTSLLAKLEKLKARKAKIPCNVVVISGPSGVGKDTIVAALKEKGYELEPTVSYTTRKPRPGEVEGVHYYFISKEQFDKMAANGEFCQQNRLGNGTCYGGTQAEIKAKRMGHDVILNISADAGANVKKEHGKNAVLLYVDAPSEEAVRKRLIGRGTETAETLAVRMDYNKMQARYVGDYDKVIINDVLPTAVDETFKYLESRQGWMVKSFNKAIRAIEQKLKLMA